MQSPSSLRLLLDLRRVTHGDQAVIDIRRRDRLRRLIGIARERSRVYADRYRGLPDFAGDLSQLPPIDKHTLMAHFDDWLTDPAVTRRAVDAFIADPERAGRKFLGKYLVFTTSGSTGEPAILVQPPDAVLVYSALGVARASNQMLRPGTLWKLLRGGFRAATVYVTGGHFGGHVLMRSRILERPYRARIQRSFSALAPLPHIVEQLNAFRPVMLSSYASVLTLLAEEKAHNRLHIAPAFIAQAGETLMPWMRDRIEAAFHCPVSDSYSASEALVLAGQCGHGRLHLNADWYIFEPIDQCGRAVPAGTQSHSVLVTNLANTLQPIIRYQLDDRVTIHPDRCACGSPLPAIDVEGRTDDVLSFRAGDGSVVQLLPLALTTVIEAVPGLHQFQVIQTGVNILTIRYDTQSGVDPDAVWDAVDMRVRRHLSEHRLPAVDIRRSAAPPAADPRSGKFRQVFRQFTPPG